MILADYQLTRFSLMPKYSIDKVITHVYHFISNVFVNLLRRFATQRRCYEKTGAGIRINL